MEKLTLSFATFGDNYIAADARVDTNTLMDSFTLFSTR